VTAETVVIAVVVVTVAIAVIARAVTNQSNSQVVTLDYLTA
jgi:uncharacterized membrane protein YciS (DUF1049 family)